MNPRLENILAATVKSFIKTGEPVSSNWLFNNYNFDIKPAMIRHELEELTELGFLEQPHHSAGRVPSNRGYEFYIQTILEDEALEPALDQEIVGFFISSDWSNFSTSLSKNLGLLSVIDPKSDDIVYKSGLETLLDQISWETTEEVRRVIKDFEEIDARIRKVSTNNMQKAGTMQIFIGQSPITDSQELSVIIERCDIGGDSIILAGVGPKRMNYKKVVKTFKGLKDIKNGRGRSKK
ncbi:MAG: heat shock gene repressor HrcA [Parcubacteria group bacterium Gr01-1014_20]|nr:MAG: heat shock gene repressor HrcA [Parcubacteria group bacterium Gr01-1014_20]